MKRYALGSFALTLTLAAVACPATLANADRPITTRELVHAGGANTLDAVKQLRPAWLHSADEPPTAVYIESRCPLTCLRWVQPDLVEGIRYVDGVLIVTLLSR